jgi:iron complex transport system substrate-binding protein
MVDEPTTAGFSRHRAGASGAGVLGLGSILFVLGLAIGCVGGPAGTSRPCQDEVPSPRRSTGRLHLEHAENFDVRYAGGVKWVAIRNGWPGSGFVQRLALVPCGVEAPPEDGETLVVGIPPRRVVTTSTTQLPHLVSLGVVDRLVGHHGLRYVNTEEVRRRVDEGAVVEVGDGLQVDLETLFSVEPDLVLGFSSGDPRYDLPRPIGELSVPWVLTAAHMEATPLARAEWLKLTALFFDREREAEALFASIAERYEELATLGASVGHRPQVLVGAPFRGVWHVPGGGSYVARYVADAGGAYLWADDSSTGSRPVDLEAALVRAAAAEVWLDPSQWQALVDGRRADRRFAKLPAWRARRVYQHDARRNATGGDDFWETGTLRPDLVLADILAILHPELVPEHRLVFYRRLE